MRQAGGEQSREIDFNCAFCALCPGKRRWNDSKGKARRLLGETLSTKHVQAGRHAVLEVLQLRRESKFCISHERELVVAEVKLQRDKGEHAVLKKRVRDGKGIKDDQRFVSTFR